MAKRLPQDGPVHRFVAEDGGSHLGEVAIREDGNRTQIGADGPLLELGGESRNIGLSFWVGKDKDFGPSIGVPPSFFTVAASAAACSL